ncbi:hypothetical protein [Limnobacter sp.]|uniref:hypothetical protein n=1 Tax=Limnobacter sp. TaxID=2003368 RepID=UPI003513C716
MAKAFSTVPELLRALGLQSDVLEPTAETEGYRIEFEQQFTVELHGQANCPARMSTRLCMLGKSLQVQDSQLQKAMLIYTDILDEVPRGCSLAVSEHDNCLRVVCDLLSIPQAPGALEQVFHEFVNFAFAFKQTYIQTKSLPAHA